MKTIYDILDEISHQLNSPLAGAKSYVYLIRQLLKSNDTKKIQEYLNVLDERIDIVAARVSLIVTMAKLENTKTIGSYHLFDISELTHDDTCHQDILADKELLQEAFAYAHELSGTQKCTVTLQKKTAIIRFKQTNRKRPEDKDHKTDRIEKAAILHHIIRLHGGLVKETKTETVLTLPLTPKKTR